MRGAIDEDQGKFMQILGGKKAIVSLVFAQESLSLARQVMTTIAASAAGAAGTIAPRT
jgi:hypothetical protein